MKVTECVVAGGLALFVFGGAAPLVSAQERLGEIPKDQWNDAQKKAAAQMTGPFPIGGPFAVMMRTPALNVPTYAMATYFRTDTLLGVKLTEMAILMVARDWSQQFEWNAHVPRAVQAGLKQDIVNALAERRHPSGMSDDEEMVYDFITELNVNKGVSDATYARVLKRFGEQGPVTLASLDGYYYMLAMVLNVARTPVPKPQVPLLPALP